MAGPVDEFPDDKRKRRPMQPVGQSGEKRIVCSLFNLSANPADVAEALGIADAATLPPMKPRYNIAPTQMILSSRSLRAKRLFLGPLERQVTSHHHYLIRIPR